MTTFKPIPTDPYRSIICGNIRAHHKSSFLHNSVQALLNSSTVEFFGIFNGTELLCFGAITPRFWSFDGYLTTGYSIGVVTTLIEHRGKGYASALIDSINEFIRLQRNASFSYLQGIDHFYTRLGYAGFAPKRKYTINTADIPSRKANVRLASAKDAPLLKCLYENYATLFSSYTIRSESVWSDLLGPLGKSFLFYMPRIVEDESGHPFGYFCTSPDNPTVIREFVPSSRRKSVDTMLYAIATSEPFHNCSRLDIFAPLYGPVLDCASHRIRADYHCFLRPCSSNMFKWLADNQPAQLDQADVFIFQADNL